MCKQQSLVILPSFHSLEETTFNILNFFFFFLVCTHIFTSNTGTVVCYYFLISWNYWIIKCPYMPYPVHLHPAPCSGLSTSVYTGCFLGQLCECSTESPVYLKKNHFRSPWWPPRLRIWHCHCCGLGCGCGGGLIPGLGPPSG